MNAREDRTAIRLKLYDNGFTPLPNRNKMSLIKGWSTIDVTPDLIQSREWARSRSLQDTGLRCGDIIALDWDVDDEALLNKMLDGAVESGIVAESSFVRIGRAPRELWVYRTNDKIGKRTTGHFVPPGSEADHSGFAVEVLGRGCQFAAFGLRDETTWYAWPGDTPIERQYMDLPLITLQQVEALVSFATFFFESNGLERRSRGGGTDDGYTHAYDLTDGMVFDVQDLGSVTLAELKDILLANPDDVLRCKADTFRPSSGSWACMASLVAGEVCVSDHGTYTSHFPTSSDLGAKMEELGRLLAERFPEPAPRLVERPTFDPEKLQMDPGRGFDENLGKALQRYVFVGDSNGTVCDLCADNYAPRTMTSFGHLMAPYYRSERGKQGGDTQIWLADLWRHNPKRLTADGMAMRPDQPWPIFVEGSSPVLNTYRPLDLPTTGDPRIGFGFLEHLLPIPAERAYFIQWLAHKLLYPHVRGPGIVMVAHETFGTGRGSLVQLIRQMFSKGLVNEIDFKTLAGSTYQSQYNEWLSDSLIVAVSEAQETAANISRWQTRSNAYERLKEVIDPSGTDMNVVRKGQRNGAARTFASIMVMTNHMDSVVLPANDRRLAILENGTTADQSYWDVFHAWRKDLANVGAFVAELKKTDLSGYSAFSAPPMTAAKADMVDAGASDLDRLVADAMKPFHNTVLVKEQLVLAVEDLLIESSAEVPDDWAAIVARMFLRLTRKVTAINDRVKIDGRQRTVRAVGRPDPQIFADASSMTATVVSNGPITRPVRSSGKVVSFPQR